MPRVRSAIKVLRRAGATGGSVFRYDHQAKAKPATIIKIASQTGTENPIEIVITPLLQVNKTCV